MRVQGPLRIYWGLKKPIMLKQYDEVPSVPIPKKRLSVFTDTRDLKPLPEVSNVSQSQISAPAVLFKSRISIICLAPNLTSPENVVLIFSLLHLLCIHCLGLLIENQ